MQRTLSAATLAVLFAVSCAGHRGASQKPAAETKEAAPKTETQPDKSEPTRVETRKFWTLPHADWETVLPNGDPQTLPKGLPFMIFVNTASKASIQVFEFQIEDGSTVMMAERMRRTLRKSGYTVGDLESSDAMPGQPSLFTFRKEDDEGDLLAGQVLAMCLHENPEVQLLFVAIWPEAVTVEMTNDLYSIAQHFQVRIGDEADPPPAPPTPPGRSKSTTVMGPKSQGETQ